MSFVEVLNHLMKETSTSNLALGKAVPMDRRLRQTGVKVKRV